MNERWNEIDDVDLLQLEAELQGELQDLRAAATVYADRAWERGGAVAVRRPALRHGWLAWAAAGVAAAALTLGGARLAEHGTLQQARAPQAAAEPAPKAVPVSDEALLEQIQSDLSSGVPAAMEPLQASSDAPGVRNAVKP